MNCENCNTDNKETVYPNKNQRSTLTPSETSVIQLWRSQYLLDCHWYRVYSMILFDWRVKIHFLNQVLSQFSNSFSSEGFLVNKLFSNRILITKCSYYQKEKVVSLEQLLRSWTLHTVPNNVTNKMGKMKVLKNYLNKILFLGAPLKVLTFIEIILKV